MAYAIRVGIGAVGVGDKGMVLIGESRNIIKRVMTCLAPFRYS